MPHAFYTFDFSTRRLPAPPGISFGFNVLFAIPIQSKSTFAVQLALFIRHICAEVKDVSTSIKLWDLTFRIDDTNAFGTLQFETRVKHDKVHMECRFLSSSMIVSHPHLFDITFYRELSGNALPGDAVSTYLRHINDSIRYVGPNHIYCLLLTTSQRSDRRL